MIAQAMATMLISRLAWRLLGEAWERRKCARLSAGAFEMTILGAPADTCMMEYY